MIAVRFDPTGSHHVRWPETADDILHLARRYTTWQAALPAAQQLKDVPLATVQTLLAQAEAASSSATTGETGRAIAAETLRQRFAQAKPLIARIILRLKLTHADNLAQLEAWGLATRPTSHGVSVRTPSTSREQVAFLRAYVAKETGLIEGQQITDPPLATVEALFEDLETALNNRTLGRDQRELGVEQRGDVQSELLRWLQTAAMLLVMQNGGAISTALQQHGYTVVLRTSNGGPANGGNGNGEPVQL